MNNKINHVGTFPLTVDYCHMLSTREMHNDWIEQ